MTARPTTTRARAVLAKIGQRYDPRYAAVGQLDAALRGIAEAGLPLTNGLLSVYAEHIGAITAAEVGGMPRRAAAESVEYAVIGTVVYEPALAALCWLAHQDIAAGQVDAGAGEP
jgi:hypothetical protein